MEEFYNICVILNSTGLSGLVGIKLLAIFIIYYVYRYAKDSEIEQSKNIASVQNNQLSMKITKPQNHRFLKNVTEMQQNIIVLLKPKKEINIGTQKHDSTDYKFIKSADTNLNNISIVICDMISKNLILNREYRVVSYHMRFGVFKVHLYTLTNISFTIYIEYTNKRDQDIQRVIYARIINTSCAQTISGGKIVAIEAEMRTALVNMGLQSVVSDRFLRWHLT